MHFYAIKNAFNGGELDPLVLSRVDLPRYQTGCKVMENFVPIPQGGVTRRPGTQFVGLVKNPAAKTGHTTLRPFIFSEVQGRVLELGDKYMRVWLPNATLVYKNGAPFELSLPYTAEHVKELSFAQSADVIYVAHSNYPPAKIMRYADDDWRYEALQLLPSIAAPAYLSLTAVGNTPGSGSKTYSYVVTAISAQTGEESAPTSPYSIYASSLSQTYFIRIAWPAVAGALQYRIYKKYGGTHAFIGTTVDTSFDDINSEVDSDDTPPEWQNPFAENYPAIAFFHEQRLGFAAPAAKPMTVYLSKTAEFENFSGSTPPKPDDAIEATLAAKQANRIQWVEPDATGLMIGTEGNEWSLEPSEGTALSPLDLAFVPQTNIGSKKLPALTMDSGIVFVQRGCASVRQIAYNFQADKMLGQDLSLLAPHILKDKDINSWALQQVPHSIIWMVLTDGALVGLTLMREQEVVAWHRHSTEGTFEDVISLPGTPDDAVWFLVRRNGQVYIERLSPFFDTNYASAVFCDASLSYAGQPADLVQGLQHLEGMQAIAFADGANVPQQTVVNGTYPLPYPASTITVGLSYNSTLVPVTPHTQTQNGHSLLMQSKTVHMNVHTHKSLAFSYGFDLENLYDLGDRTLNPQTNTQPDFYEDSIFKIPLGAGFNVQDIYLVSREAAPLTILAIGQLMEVASEKGGL